MSTDTYRYDYTIGEQIGETDDGQPVVAEPGDGSLESGTALKDVNRPQNRRAARGEGRTAFSPEEADNEAKYRRLWQHDSGRYADEEVRRQQEIADIAEALCDALHVPDATTRHVQRLVAELEGRAFNRIGGVYAMALGAIAVVDNRTIETVEEFENRIQVREITDHDGERIYDHDAPRFQHLADKLGVDWNTAKKRVEEQTSGQ